MHVLRIIHIQRNSDSRPDDPRYDIIDAGRYSEEAGYADTSRSLTRADVGDWLAREGLPYETIGQALGELAETGSAQVQAPPRIGPRIVRAWFDAVLNPLLDFVEVELGLLQRRNWTFSFAGRTLELLQPVTRPGNLQTGERELRADSYATRLWLFHDGAAIRKSAAEYLARLRSEASHG